MTPSATTARGGRKAAWTRDKCISALRRYAALYGDGFTAAAFSPATAKWRDDALSIERYYAGDPDGGSWPSLNALKAQFGGSFNDARVAAGLTPNKPGSKKRAAGAHAPVRNVSHVGATRTVFIERQADAEVLGRVERARDRALARAERAEALAAIPKTITKTVKVRDDAALRAARARAKGLAVDVKRLTLLAERAVVREAELAREVARRAAGIGTGINDGHSAAPRVVEVEVERVVTKTVERITERPHPGEAKIAAAREQARAADRRVAAAEKDARAAEASYAELAVAVKGSARKLAPGEVAELRAKGPSGPAVLGAALKELAAARSGRGNLKTALTEVASAALTWRDRA